MSASVTQQVVLITAGGGNIGSRLVPMLLKDPAQHKVVIPTNNASRLAHLYPEAGSQLVLEEGKIQDPQWIQSILTRHKVSSVFLCLTGDDELMTTLNFFDSMKRAGTVKHLVYLSACGDFSLDAIKAGVLKLIGPEHVAVKFLIEAKLKYGMPSPTSPNGFTHTIIGPTLFFSNDLRSKKNMLERGFFDEPMTPKGVSRVATSDIASAIYNSLIHDRGEKFHDRKIMVGSKRMFTNTDIQKLWSDGLGRPIRVADVTNEKDLDDFEEHFTKVRNAAWGRDMRMMYEIFAAMPFGMTDEDYKNQVQLLGKEPEDYVEFVKETAAKWLEEEK